MPTDVPYDLLGLILGVLGTVGLIPLIWAVILSQLPGYKLQQLDATFQETTSLLESAVQDGLVPTIKFVREMENRLSLHRNLTETLRTEVLRAEGFRQQFVAALRGLSGRVDYVCAEVRKLRTRIVTASDEERRKAAKREQRRVASTANAGRQIHLSLNADDLDDALLDGDQGGENTGPVLSDTPTSSSISPPLPTYVYHTPNTFYEPVRHGSMSYDSADHRLNIAMPLPWLPSAWPIPIPSQATTPPDLSRGSSSSILPRWSSGAQVKGNDLIGGSTDVHLQQVPYTTHNPVAAEPADTSSLVSEITERILESLHHHIASSVQSALEHHSRTPPSAQIFGDEPDVSVR